MPNQCNDDYNNLLAVLGQLKDATPEACVDILNDQLIYTDNCYKDDIVASYGYPDAPSLAGLCGCLNDLKDRASEAEALLTSTDCRPDATQTDGCGHSCQLVCVNIFFNPPLCQTNTIFRFYVSISATVLNASTATFSITVTEILLPLQLLPWNVAPECLTTWPHKGQTII